MLSMLSQGEFNAMIVLAALVRSFQPGETYLSSHQLSFRGFAPTESYGSLWIDELVAKKFIDGETISRAMPNGGVSRTLLIRRPFEVDDDQDKSFDHLCSKICRLICSDFQYSLYLKELMLEVLACECIEYAKHCASKSNLIIVKESCNDYRLKSLLLECEQGQVFMLIWQAIKNIAIDSHALRREVSFFRIVDSAMRSFTKYKRQGTIIEHFDRPRIMRLSLLKELLEQLTNEKESYLQKIMK